MALHRDIFWVGRQWAVTGSGMQAVNQKLLGEFDVAIARLWDDDWLDVLRVQPWLNADDFAKALAVARARYPEPGKAVSPPLPVEALLRAPGARSGLKPASAKPQPKPAVGAGESVPPEKPAPSFLQMSIAEHSARLLRVWRVRRRQ